MLLNIVVKLSKQAKPQLLTKISCLDSLTFFLFKTFLIESNNAKSKTNKGSINTIGARVKSVVNNATTKAKTIKAILLFKLFTPFLSILGNKKYLFEGYSIVSNVKADVISGIKI